MFEVISNIMFISTSVHRQVVVLGWVLLLLFFGAGYFLAAFILPLFR